MAINVGANSTLPGIRGRLFTDGRFEYIPIPERSQTARSVPTYGDLEVAVPEELLDTEVHLDPSFPEVPGATEYTYGDEHGVKAAPLGALDAGDMVWFYASLSPVSGSIPWSPANWGAFIIGEFRLEVDPLVSPELDAFAPSLRRRCVTNAHFARAEPDARVLLLGDPDESRLLDRAVPLSSTVGGVIPNRCVTYLSADSGRGPWWRRPLRFDPSGTSVLRALIDRWQQLEEDAIDDVENTLESLERTGTHVPGDPP